MSTLLIRHAEHSTTRKVTCDCKEPDDCDNKICQTHTMNYVLGKCPPNYQVPAIPLEVFIDYDLVVIRKQHYKKRVSHWYKPVF